MHVIRLIDLGHTATQNCVRARCTITTCAEEAKKSKKSKKDKPDSFTEKLVTNLLKNMEVKVRDIHVRYEDSSGAGRTLAAGVTLHSLEMKVRARRRKGIAKNWRWEGGDVGRWGGGNGPVVVTRCVSTCARCVLDVYQHVLDVC